MDVAGSRTMWKAIQAEPILVSKEVKYEKIQAEKLTGRLSDISILYLVTGMYIILLTNNQNISRVVSSKH